MDLEVIEVKNSLYWQSYFEKYRCFIIEKYKNSANIENYTEKRFKIQNLLGLFLVFDKEFQRIAGFMSVFTPQIWPKNIARIDNRYWIDPLYRLQGLSTCRDHRNLRYVRNWGSSIAYKHQINCCIKNKIALAVITRENTKGPDSKNNMDFLYENFKIKRPEWKLAENYYLTCSNTKDHKCWQRLAYLELHKEKSSKKWLDCIQNITLKEYQNLFNNALALGEANDSTKQETF